MKLDDATFMNMWRIPQEGGINPAKLVSENATDSFHMNPNYPFLYGITKGMAAKNVLEIGVHDGTSTLALLKAVSETGGHVTSIDLSECPIAKKLVSHFELSEHWTFVQGNSHTLLESLSRNGNKYDVIFIDGDHTYEGAKSDIDYCETMLRECGVLLTHDNWMVTADVDNNKPFGQKGIKGCGFAGLDMLSGDKWTGVVFTFGFNMGIWMRREDCKGKILHGIADAQKVGYLP